MYDYSTPDFHPDPHKNINFTYCRIYNLWGIVGVLPKDYNLTFDPAN